jgi:hypothetical protein
MIQTPEDPDEEAPLILHDDEKKPVPYGERLKIFLRSKSGIILVLTVCVCFCSDDGMAQVLLLIDCFLLF